METTDRDVAYAARTESGSCPEQVRAKLNSFEFPTGNSLCLERSHWAHAMTTANPARDGSLVNTEGVCGFLLGAEMLDQAIEDVHSKSSYGNTHILVYGQSRLQEYGRAHIVPRMEFKDRLKAARKYAKLTQARLAEIVGIDQTSISDLERGKSQSSSYVAQIAKACRVSAIWLASGEGEMAAPLSGKGGQASLITGTLTEESEASAPSSDDYALIPQYSAQGHCGEGLLNDHVEVKGGLAFKRDWLRRMGAKPQHLFVIYATGSSMEPYIFEGDVVLFDSADTIPRDRQVYAIRRPDGSISIKRMAQQISGNWLIRSDNPDKARYPDEEVSAASMAEVPIMGRVIWRGGAMA